jgi:aldose 1-epimerase
VLELAADQATCSIDPRNGGRVATLRVADVELLVGPDPSLPVMGWGSFPMVPWAGRIRRGRFTFDGHQYQLPINFEQHAIHGTAFDQKWEVVASDSSSTSMRCDLDWEFGGSTEQTIRLAGDRLICELAVRAGERPMPATLGWHPWFVKPHRVDLAFERMYVRDGDYIPDGRTIGPPSPPPWDDCFAGPRRTPRLWIADVEVAITSDCEYWVVYDMPAHATCVEPQSGPPDAFNLGLAARLVPGHELCRSMTISWQRG